MTVKKYNLTCILWYFWFLKNFFSYGSYSLFGKILRGTFWWVSWDWKHAYVTKIPRWYQQTQKKSEKDNILIASTWIIHNMRYQISKKSKCRKVYVGNDNVGFLQQPYFILVLVESLTFRIVRLTGRFESARWWLYIFTIFGFLIPHLNIHQFFKN